MTCATPLFYANDGKVTNDDGPPSRQSSPYVHSLVRTLQDAGHTVSVILPHVQRSWIGKAHFVGQVTKPTYFYPGTLHEDDGTVHERPLPENASGEEWVLVDGTPGTCAQLGLHHFFQERGPVDLVVSGPNYGRNSTSLFSLSSGTIGGAMEAATCRKKAIALSYAFYSRDIIPELIAGASRLSVRIIEHLYNNWGEEVDLYSINVPLIKGVEENKIMYTNILQNYWSSGSPFQEIEADEEEGKPGEQERVIRHQQVEPAGKTSSSRLSRHKHKHFKWAPKFTDIHKSIEENPPGNDGWAIGEGYTRYDKALQNYICHLTEALSQCHTSQGELHACCVEYERRTEAVSQPHHGCHAHTVYRSYHRPGETLRMLSPIDRLQCFS